MKVLHINTTDLGGGAEQVMLGLHHQLINAGHQSVCLVGKKQTKFDFVRELLPPSTIHRLLNEIDISRGREPTAFRNVMWQMNRAGFEPDVIHIHNLHGGYISLNDLPEISKRYKVFIHLHDMWLLTGHCAQSFDCNRWLNGCGKCPDLSIYPAVRKDATDFNWLRKRDILAQCELNFICPSQWVAEKVKTSQIAYKSLTVIPNGVDREVFKPFGQQEARKVLGIPADKKVVLFIAKNPEKNEFKDYTTLKKAMVLVADRLPKEEVELVCLGGTGRGVKHEKMGRLSVSIHPFTQDKSKVAQYYQSADVYVHPAKAETFGMTIIEAMACGAPVVASATGGIPEIIQDDSNGLLLTQGDAEQLAAALVDLLSNREKGARLSANAFGIVGMKFDMKEVSNQLLELYSIVK